MRATTLMAIAALGILAVPAASASDWIEVEDPAALRALYANKTFKGKDWMDRPVTTHYREDGQGLMLFKGTQIPIRWAVKGRDQVCVVWSAHNDCYRVQRHKAKAGALRLTDVNTDVQAVYAVEESIPKF